MKTAKALGFMKGDLVFTGMFPGIVCMDVNTARPMCEVWGVAHELGSVYAENLKLLKPDEWVDLVLRYDFKKEEPYHTEAKRAVKKLRLEGFLK